MAAAEPDFLAHHFEDLEQQHAAASLGMWIFLATELMVFGGLFTAYAVYRAVYRDAFAAGSEHLNVWYGGVNTVVLLTSSLTMALAVHAAQTGQQRALVLHLTLTAALRRFLSSKDSSITRITRKGWCRAWHSMPPTGPRRPTYGSRIPMRHGCFQSV